jgi:tRNA(Ile)-lysidine synthase
MERIRPEHRDVGFETLERAGQFLNGAAAHYGRFDLTGEMHLLREGLLLYVVAGDATLPVERWPQMPDDSRTIPLKIPDLIELSGGWKLNCERWNIASLAMEQARSNDDPFQVWLDANGISDALELRVRQVGDRFEPLGMNGKTMKISDFFINVKLPQRARARWPLLCMGAKVVWVPGYRPAHSFRLTDSTRQALYFSLTRSS